MLNNYNIVNLTMEMIVDSIPLAFNLVDYASNAVLIGKMPASSTIGHQDLLYIWQDQFKSSEILKKGGKFIVSSDSYSKKYTRSGQIDDFFQEIAPMPESEKTITFFIVSNPLEWNSDFLTSVINTARPKHCSIVLFVEDCSALHGELQKAIFANCHFIVVGKLNENDKSLFLKERYFKENTEAIVNIKEDEYVFYYQDYPPQAVFYAGYSRKNP